MRALFEYAAHVRDHIEATHHCCEEGLDLTTRAALVALVEFAIAAMPAPSGAPAPAPKSPHTLYTHPNGRCCITIEPNDLRAPYYEWRRVYGSWALYDRHCWRSDALLAASGRPRDWKKPSTYPPPPPPAPPSVEIMPLEEQIRQALLVEKDRRTFDGSTLSAQHCLTVLGFDLNARDVRLALFKVLRGIPSEVQEELPAWR